MSIRFNVLGKPGRDNALMVWIDSGDRLYRILFDCGENLLNSVEQSEIKAIDYIFFSHLHIDHVAGFDYFFRRNYLREKPILIWGPEETASIIHCRLKGYKWNLVDELPGTWYITDIAPNICKTYRYKTADSFRNEYFIKQVPFEGLIVDNDDFKVEAVLLNHIIPTIGYSVTEKSTYNINKDELLEINIEPGTWLQKVKDFSFNNDEMIEINNDKYRLGFLREKLLYKKRGEKISYLTDFIYDESTVDKLIKVIYESDVLVCESQYAEKDSELAKQNYHMTTHQTAEIAKAAKVKKLILFHISERYLTQDNYSELLDEAREVFPETYFPEKW